MQQRADDNQNKKSSEACDAPNTYDVQSKSSSAGLSSEILFVTITSWKFWLYTRECNDKFRSISIEDPQRSILQVN